MTATTTESASILTTMFDTPMRMSVLCVDGTTKILDVISYTVEGKVQRAPSKAKLEAGAKDAPPADVPPSKGRVYPVPAFTDDELKALTRGDWDDPVKLATKPHQRRCLEALCAMRGRFFNITSPTYIARDAQIYSAMHGAGVKPSEIARAIFVAGGEDWWKERGDIGWESLQRETKRLAALYVKARNDPKKMLQRLLPRLDDADRMFAEVVRAQLAKATPEEATSLLERAKARLAASTTTG